MKALTLWPEWAYAIAHLGKDGENRTWPLPEYLIGVPIAIHAGVRPIIGVNEGTLRAEELHAFRESCRIVGVPKEAGHTLRGIDPIRGSIASIVTFAASVLASPSPWAVNQGDFFWPITSRRVLAKPVKCKGAQGLWTVPPEIERLIVGQS